MVTIGSANTSSSWTTSAIQMNTGIRKKLMPGARMLMIVTTRFTAETVDAIPKMMSPIA